MWLWCVTLMRESSSPGSKEENKSRECPGAWLSSEWALRACSKAGSLWLHTKPSPVCVGELWNRSPRKTLEFPCWQTFKFGLEKAQSSWPLLCREPSFTRRLERRLQPPFHLILHGKCSQWGGVFAPLVLLRDLKHCLEGCLSPGATATLKSSFYSVPTEAGNFLPLQTSDLYLQIKAAWFS